MLPRCNLLTRLTSSATLPALTHVYKKYCSSLKTLTDFSGSRILRIFIAEYNGIQLSAMTSRKLHSTILVLNGWMVRKDLSFPDIIFQIDGNCMTWWVMGKIEKGKSLSSIQEWESSHHNRFHGKCRCNSSPAFLVWIIVCVRSLIDAAEEAVILPVQFLKFWV